MITRIYEENPNPREVRQVASALRDGKVAIIPTDTLYAFVCGIEHRQAVDVIARMKGYNIKQAKYALMCASLSQASEYLRPLDKPTFALLRQCLPGPFTFILEANGNVPRTYQNANRTIGIRVPSNEVARAIIEDVGTPLVCTSVRPLGDSGDEPEQYTDPELIHERFGRQVHVVVDGGLATDEVSTVIDCTADFVITRQGKGIVEI
ncbi:MAG: threonylcarbamoyl-AMP synthase [Bacteroidales bacterium]|nr:threonylcarbamoyl-AMP synthase [Bacteroidales bacterium]